MFLFFPKHYTVPCLHFRLAGLILGRCYFSVTEYEFSKPSCLKGLALYIFVRAFRKACIRAEWKIASKKAIYSYANQNTRALIKASKRHNKSNLSQ